MSGLARRWRSLEELLGERERAETMALLRMLVGAVALWTFLDAVITGSVEVIWIDRGYGGYRTFPNPPWLIALLGGATPRVVWSLVVAGATSAALTLVGLGGRVPVLIAGQTFLALHRLNEQATGSGDLAIDNALWLLFLSSSTATWSLDARIRTGSFATRARISAVPRYLVILQLVVMYFSSGMQKVSASWLPIGDCSALYYILQQPTWQRFDMRWAARVYPLTQLATAVTWLWEVASPVLLVFLHLRRTAQRGGRLRRWATRFDLRKLWLALALLVHGAIFVTMNVGAFTLIALSLYAALFRPAEISAALSRIARTSPGAGAAE